MKATHGNSTVMNETREIGAYQAMPPVYPELGLGRGDRRRRPDQGGQPALRAAEHTVTAVAPLRVGILGAARIAELAIVKPAHATGTRLVMVAARDRRRAEAFAAQYGVERATDSYAAVLGDPEVEVVYNPLPNAMHGPWNLAAVQAGKHVLSEKPFASTAEEAAEVRDAAQKAGVTVVEGFHYLFHPVMRRLFALLGSGELGELQRVDALIAMPEPDDGDPRWSFDLAGGALMDLGCYGLHAHRALGRWTGGEPELVDARAKERAGAPGVDEWLEADLRFPSGATGAARCSMVHPRFEMTLRVEGSRGEATVMDFVQPHKDDRVVVRTGAGETTERLGVRSSYIYQLEELIQALRGGAPMPTGPDDAVATAQLIDQCYRAAGLPLRPRTAPIA
jgi:predicted dehydrogenase